MDKSGRKVRTPEEKEERANIKAEAKKLVAQGMPEQLAMAVGLGKLSLSAALERMALSDRVERVAAEYDLTRALAMQVVIGHADLEVVLRKRRYELYKREKFSRSILATAHESNEELVLGVHGGQRLKVTITAVRDFTVSVVDQKGNEEELKKIVIKYAYLASSWKEAGKQMKLKSSDTAVDVGPIDKPQDRFRCSDRRLFRLFEEKQQVCVELLEGDSAVGILSWLSKYEIGINVGKSCEIGVFRHAVGGLKSLR
jgi:hypothetical protein